MVQLSDGPSLRDKLSVAPVRQTPVGILIHGGTRIGSVATSKIGHLSEVDLRLPEHGA